MMDNLTPSSNLGSPVPRKIPSPWGRRMKWAPDFTMNSSTKPASVNLSSRSAPVHSGRSSSWWTKAKGPPKCQGNLHRLRLKALPRTRLAPADLVSRLDRVEPVIIYTGGPWCQVGTHRPRIQGLSHEHMSQDCHCGLCLQACILDPSTYMSMWTQASGPFPWTQTPGLPTCWPRHQMSLPTDPTKWPFQNLCSKWLVKGFSC